MKWGDTEYLSSRLQPFCILGYYIVVKEEEEEVHSFAFQVEQIGLHIASGTYIE